MSKPKPPASENPFNTLLQGRLNARIKGDPSDPKALEPSAPDNPETEDILDAEVIEPPAIAPAVSAAPAIAPAVPKAPASITRPAPRLRAKSRAQVRAERKRLKAEAEAQNIRRKRGRPANGKRSDPDWIGRTFYVRKQTDTKLEDAIRKLRRSGIDVDKSQLVDALLYAWAAVELGEADNLELGDILERPQD